MNLKPNLKLSRKLKIECNDASLLLNQRSDKLVAPNSQLLEVERNWGSCQVLMQDSMKYGINFSWIFKVKLLHIYKFTKNRIAFYRVIPMNTKLLIIHVDWVFNSKWSDFRLFDFTDLSQKKNLHLTDISEIFKQIPSC